MNQRINELETELAAKEAECARLREDKRVMGEALKNLLDDMTQRAKDLSDYSDKPVELPIGNSVLFEARKALTRIEGTQPSKTEALLNQAIDRIKDILQGDDGQAEKEARKFLENNKL